MGFGDIFFGLRKEGWYRGELKHYSGQDGLFSIFRPKIFVRSHQAKNIDRLNGSSDSFMAITKERIRELIKDMKKHGYRYQDLLQTYDASEFDI